MKSDLDNAYIDSLTHYVAQQDPLQAIASIAFAWKHEITQHHAQTIAMQLIRAEMAKLDVDLDRFERAFYNTNNMRFAVVHVLGDAYYKAAQDLHAQMRSGAKAPEQVYGPIETCLLLSGKRKSPLAHHKEEDAKLLEKALGGPDITDEDRAIMQRDIDKAFRAIAFKEERQARSL